jgi:hypothetical protein
MQGFRSILRGASWPELLMVVAAAVLLFQVFPEIPQTVVEALDFRRWSRPTWFFVNLGVVMLLLVVRFGPSVVDSCRQVLINRPVSKVTESRRAEFRGERLQDVRVLMRRDEEFRKRWRQKLAIYCLAGPCIVLVLAAATAWLRGERREAFRSASTLLRPDVGAEFHGDVQGVVGIKFRVRADRDMRVTHLGVYDNSGDGLQVEYRTGLFRLDNERQMRGDLIAEVTVPYGNQAALEGMFRWAPLSTPVTLKAGTVYVVASEVFNGAGDYWPGSFDETASAANTVGQAWNPLVADDEGSDSRSLLHTDQPWPAVPDRIMATTGMPHGPANLIVSDAE